MSEIANQRTGAPSNALADRHTQSITSASLPSDTELMISRRQLLASVAAGLAAGVAATPPAQANAVERARAQGTNSLTPIRRRFIRAQGQGVHYLRAGKGPPAVLLHSANLSALSMVPLLQQLASDHTVFAFDHPGFGDSDPLPEHDVQVADAADVLMTTLVALKLPPCPIYGSHTGGAVALELARRHPQCVSALIMDGVTLFDEAATKVFLSEDYMPHFSVKGDGSHLLSSWVKTRDARMWFPWHERTAGNRLRGPLPSPETLQELLVERLRAGDGYRHLYGAVFRLDVRQAVTDVTVPATFMAATNDVLYPHLDRLPPLKANQAIHRPAPGADYMADAARVIGSYRGRQSAPQDARFHPTPGAINRRYVDLAGGQILVRSAGENVGGRPLLLLHDGRASSRVFEPLMRKLADKRAIYAPDLPDNGASDPLTSHEPTISEYADAAADTMTALGFPACDIYAVGAGASVASELLMRSAFADSVAIMEAPDFYSPAFSSRLGQEWVPSLTPQWDGGHLNRLWLMLRDELAFWPWFDKSLSAACAVDAPTQWHELHARVTDILRSLPTYQRLTLAALRYDWPAALRAVKKRQVTLATTTQDPKRPHVEAAAGLAKLPDVLVLPSNVDEKAPQILKFFSA